ncbi:MAG: endonuclease/exonuclease/phosphatase family protein [Actinomycetota bacterium]
MVLWGSDAQPAAAPEGTFRLIDYNVHNGVSPSGQLNPEAIARVIEAERPDVVTLNEVNRGWAIAGTIDLAEWLSQRLDLPYVYGKAADGQFGNAVMSRFPITRVERLTLPKAAGPMVRNATLATLDLGNSRVVDVVALHLDHRDEGRETRLAQIDVLLDAWNERPVTVFAGDMNATPESEEIAAMTRAGLVSAQDEAGDPGLKTFPSDAPDRRIDYVFGSNGIAFSNFRIPRTTASDHLPLLVTVAAD